MLNPLHGNFCTLQNKNDYNFKILEETWIEFSARVNGHSNSPDFYVAGWLQIFQNIYRAYYGIF